jgi:hypothetical protein
MIYTTIKNRTVIVTNVRHSQCRWYFVLNDDGSVEKARVMPPEALIYGDKITLDNLSEEDLPRYTPQPYNEPTEAVNTAIVTLEEVLSRRYGIENPRQSTLFRNLFLRNRIVKQYLGLEDFNDEEYSNENIIKSTVAEGDIILNHAMKPICLTYIKADVVEEHTATENTVEQVQIKESDDNSINIEKPKDKFQG